MKIAVVAGWFPLVSETFIYDQIDSLKEQGNDVDLFAFKKTKAQVIHPAIIKYNLLEACNYMYFPKVRLYRFLFVLRIIFRYLFLHPRTISKCLFKLLTHDRYEAINQLIILSYFINKSYDIILCHFGPNGKKLIFLKDYVSSKLVTIFHGYDLGYKFNSGFYDQLFEKSDLNISVSNYFKEKLIRFGCPIDKIKVCYLGIDISRFNYIERRLNVDERIKLITVSRLVEKKGLPYAILAVADLCKKYKNIKYDIIGDGENRDVLLSIINKLKLEDNVRLLGILPEKEVLKNLHSSHIFILPSITADNGDQEGIPTVLKEAMATGLPVISTFHAGIPELDINLGAGYLVPEKDHHSLVNKIAYLISNPSDYKKSSMIARKIIEEKFNASVLNKELLKTLKEIVYD